MLMGQHGITTLHAGWVGTATETHSLRAREAMSAQPPQQGKTGPGLNRTEGSQRGGTPPRAVGMPAWGKPKALKQSGTPLVAPHLRYDGGPFAWVGACPQGCTHAWLGLPRSCTLRGVWARGPGGVGLGRVKKAFRGRGWAKRV